PKPRLPTPSRKRKHGDLPLRAYGTDRVADGGGRAQAGAPSLSVVVSGHRRRQGDGGRPPPARRWSTTGGTGDRTPDEDRRRPRRPRQNSTGTGWASGP